MFWHWLLIVLILEEDRLCDTNLFTGYHNRMCRVYKFLLLAEYQQRFSGHPTSMREFGRNIIAKFVPNNLLDQVIKDIIKR